jgi:hypothetical protein
MTEKQSRSTPWSPPRVNSVLMGKNGQGITLNLSNNEQVSLADIMQIM